MAARSSQELPQDQILLVQKLILPRDQHQQAALAIKAYGSIHGSLPAPAGCPAQPVSFLRSSDAEILAHACTNTQGGGLGHL